MRRQPSLAIVVHSLGIGGAERMMLALAGGMAQRGWRVELIAVQAIGALAQQIPSGVRLHDLGAARVRTALPALIRRLRRLRPDAVLGTPVQINTLLCVAAPALRRSLLALREASNGDPGLADKHPAERWGHLLMPLTYRAADLLICISEGIAAELQRRGLPLRRMALVPNPTVDPIRAEAARCAPPAHPWFTDRTHPVVVAVGRLAPEKGFEDLLLACSRLRTPVRVLLVGEGPSRDTLLALAQRLGISDRVQLPGAMRDPLPVMAQASVVALTSRYEGCPNALIEALAVGATTVAYDCPHGPREILDHGRWGTLVPAGDVDALTAALATALLPAPATGPDPAIARMAWARRWSVRASTAGYGAALLRGVIAKARGN